MAKKKKEEEEDAWLWMSQPFSPGATPIAKLSTLPRITLPGRGSTKDAGLDYTTQSFEVDFFRMRQRFNFPAYAAYATILPTPLEQIAFAYDPLGIVPPYEWRGGFNAILDVAASVADPIGIARSKLVNPYHAVHGKPDPNYWNTEEGQGLTELFASRN